MQKILLASDFQEASQSAAEAAALLSRQFGARVNVLHVLESFPAWRLQPPQQEAAVLEYLENKHASVGTPVMGIGPPAATIVDKAIDLAADLIVIGVGEERRFEHLAVGPIAEAILEQATQPVLAVRPGNPPLQFRRILCPVDHSTTSRRGLENAIRLAEAFDSELIVASVVPKVSWVTAAAETGKLAQAQMEYDLQWAVDFDKFLDGVSFGDLKWSRDLRKGEPGKEIVEAARSHQADLIVMGATGRTGLVRVLLGSTTRRVLRHLLTSILVVKEEELLEEVFSEDLLAMQRWMEEGRLLLKQGASESALNRFRQVLARDPFHVGAVEGRAEAYEKLGRADEARFYRQRATKLRQQAWA